MSREIAIMDDCVRRGPDAVNWRSLALERPFVLLSAGHALGVGGRQPACAEAAYRALLRNDTATGGAAEGRHWAALVGITSLLLGQGRTAVGAAQLDSAIAGGLGGTSLYLQAAAAGLDVARQATEVARADQDFYGERYERIAFATRLWQLGLWEASRGDSARVGAIARHLDRWADSSGLRFDHLLARSMHVHEAVVRGDTTQAMALLENLVPTAPAGGNLAWDVAESLGPERLLYARLLLARRRFQEALDVASGFDSPLPVIYPMYLAASLEVRASAADGLGEDGLARRYRRRLDAFRGTAAEAD